MATVEVNQVTKLPEVIHGVVVVGSSSRIKSSVVIDQINVIIGSSDMNSDDRLVTCPCFNQFLVDDLFDLRRPLKLLDEFALF